MQLEDMIEGTEYSMPDIANTYGGLLVRKLEGKYEWAVESWCACKWFQIQETLACELMKLI